MEGDASAETTGLARAGKSWRVLQNSAERCVTGLSLSPITACLACTQYPSAEKLSPFCYRCHKDTFLTRQTIAASS
ncbi:hypothetical protein V6N12_063804 [Hibiscus sabdariffa]|uniref:Uncharacterized protein n=1 Tax=Hibiscus sabdariffa TaxID=183260 RepID=A0ABR2BCE2_9ROSI